MDYLHKVQVQGSLVRVKATTGREFVVSKSFMDGLVAIQDQFHKYGMVSTSTGDIKFTYSGDRARFTTPAGLFEFDKPTFFRMLKSISSPGDSMEKTFLGQLPGNNCEGCS